MKKQIKKQNKLESRQITNHLDKTKALKWVIIGFGIAILALWISWFTCDCIFVSNGIKVAREIPTEGQPIGWSWNKALYRIQEIQGITLLGMLGVFMGLSFSYMVICGLHVKSNMKKNLYQLLATAGGLIAILICVIKASQMMIAQKYVIDINVIIESWSPFKFTAAFNVFHLDFLKWMSIPPGAVVFISLIVLLSFRKDDKESFIKDANLLIVTYAIMVILLTAPFIITFGVKDPAAEGIEIIEGSITWRHITAQCITCPIAVFDGMLMVLMVFRLVCVVFAYNNRWREKKRHIIIFSIVCFFVFAGFIVAHVNPLDFEKLVLDYKSMSIGGLLVVLAEIVTGIAAGTYCLISHINYNKKRA